ncbi:von Willebrand factor type A [Candidatus Moduliflexus flocculans]|uniref:von Willebrand factor type A n=1 Tax=Candidatus Moduliflexus flocculans TaxID=1499966 RepID=A0A0S6VYV4_9BACT|nr:von Willebrand factor type A [Candidatus Moduliflexus flocculans]
MPIMNSTSQQLLCYILRRVCDELALTPERAASVARHLSAAQSANEQEIQPAMRAALKALAPEMAWMFELPAIVEDVMSFGLRFANLSEYAGAAYFSAMARGGFGATPEQVRHLHTWLRRLLHERFSLSLVKGWRLLAERLSADEIDLYLEEALDCGEFNPLMTQQLLECQMSNSEAIMARLRREYRLNDIDDELETLLFALTGEQIVVAPLRELPSPLATDRQTRLICLHRGVYLPGSVGEFPARDANRQWYLLQTVIAAGMLVFGSFPCVHGHPDYPNAAKLAGISLLRQNLFYLLEYIRVVEAIRRAWPGSRRLLEFGLNSEAERHAERIGDIERLLFDALRQISAAPRDNAPTSELSRVLTQQAANCRNVFETAELVRDFDAAALLAACPDITLRLLHPLGFLPDFMYYAILSIPPSDERIRALRDAVSPSLSPTHLLAEAVELPSAPFILPAQPDDPRGTRYLYHEWHQEQHRYLPRHCAVHEREMPYQKPYAVSSEALLEGERIRRVFELLKPEETRKETRLPEGDDINPDRLVEYVSASKHEPAPPIRFFERPQIRKRDMTVLLLLDISGSTGEMAAQQKTLDIEKQSAVILGQGLAAVGDRFAICGFSSNGRERCEFLVFKDFADDWNQASRSRVLSAIPMSATRMGAALRHAGYRLQQEPARQKLLLIITDGKPLDKDYSPETRYAQHDVRMACLENRRHGIITFCVSTQENSRSDLELMFPERRFVILGSIQELRRLLPRYYMKLTR